jgi:hypothetical protein
MRHKKEISKGYKLCVTCTIEPEVVKELDSIRGELIPRFRLVEMVLKQYVETKRKERLQSASVGVGETSEALAAHVVLEDRQSRSNPK